MTQEALKKMQWHVLTQAQYDALKTKNPNDVYAIVDDKGDYTETKLNKMIFNVMSADTYKALETKDPNQIYYVTGENDIIEHKSWTDGSQNTITPAGFQDCGFRYYGYYNDSSNIVSYHWLSTEATDTDKLYVSAINSTPVYYGYCISSSDYDIMTYDELVNKITSAGIDWSQLYLQIRTLIPREDTAGLSSDRSYQIKYKTSIGFTYINLDVLPEEARAQMEAYQGFDLCTYFIIMLACVDYDDNGNVETVRPISSNYINVNCGKPNTVWNYNNNYIPNSVHINPGKTAIELVILNRLCPILLSSGLNMDCFILPVSTQESSTVAAAKADYEAITTELTARGNTITSLNTQGQNLVTAYNNLADKYNTAGIIVTED